MKLCMVGVDYQTANIEERERFGLTEAQTRAALPRIYADARVLGCVLMATCNRTELYLSVAATVDAGALLCAALGIAHAQVAGILVHREGRDAAMHLASLASGLCSQIRGEDQILTQVKRALALAHETQTTDAVLETLFRAAVTAGKRVKTEVRLSPMPTSSAHRAVEVLQAQLGALAGARCVVIGNGEIGRLVSALLVAQGAKVTITLRSYRHGITVVPTGCHTIPYDTRAHAIDGADAVVSATTSPHYTITQPLLDTLAQVPRVMIDLAVPRDIAPEAEACTTVYNVDALGAVHEDVAATRRAQDIIARQLTKFYAWADYRENIREEQPS